MFKECLKEAAEAREQNVAADADNPEPFITYGSVSTVLRACLVLLLRAGFLLIQLGCIPTENIYTIVLQNILDIAICFSSFGLIGFMLAFGSDIWGCLGFGIWIVSNSADMDDAVLGFCACIIGTAIITTLLSGRMHFVACLLASFFFCAFFQPLVMHWIWHDEGFLHRRSIGSDRVSVKDHAGAIVSHITAGAVGLVGLAIFGRRLLRYSNIKHASIGAESPGATITGYIFIALGLIAFSLPSPFFEMTHIPHNYIGIILVNSIMAMAGGIIVVVIVHYLLHRETFDYWMILSCMQGSIAGLVTVAAGVDVYTPIAAFGIASAGALLFSGAAEMMSNSALEDNCNIIPIHLVCGLFGALLPPLLGISENLGFSVNFKFKILHFLWQALSVVCVFVFMAVVFGLIFVLLEKTHYLRNHSEILNHRIATAAKMRLHVHNMERLFPANKETVLVEPGSFAKNPEEVVNLKNNEIRSNKYGKIKAIFPVLEVSSSGENQIHDAKVRNKRFVYTVQNTSAKPVQLWDPVPSSFGAGDADSSQRKNEKLNNILFKVPKKKTNNYPGNVKRNVSSYKLHRTRKMTNFCNNKRSMKKIRHRIPNQKKILQTIQYNPQMLALDKSYDGGFFYHQESVGLI